MAFRQHHRPQPSRQLSFPEPVVEASTAVPSPQRKRALDESEEWVLFSPVAPSTTTRTHTTSTERTPRTAGLSHLSDFGSLDTGARSDQGDDDDVTYHGTEEELDSLDDGLHAFHEPSEYGVQASRLQQSGDTVLPTHDGLGTFQPDAEMQDQLWQFERQAPRRRPHARRRSSVQRRLDALEEAEEIHQEQDRRQRIEQWRLEQSKALLEEIERETRRRRRMSMVSAARSRADSGHQEEQSASSPVTVARSVSDAQSEASDDSTENLSFWQRLTRRVIRDLMGIDDNTLSVIFGEALPEEAMSTPKEETTAKASVTNEVQTIDFSAFPGEPWEHRLLERVARELGILISQISGHPGAFSTYSRMQDIPEYAGLNIPRSTSSQPPDLAPTATSHTSTQSPSAGLAASLLPNQQIHTYSEASLWGIEEEPEVDPLDSFRDRQPAPPVNAAEDLAREREYWERELDVKMVFNFLLQRFSSRRSNASSQGRGSLSSPSGQAGPTSNIASKGESSSARRAAIIRQHHPLVSRNADRALPASSANKDARRKDVLVRQHLNHQTSLRSQVRSSSSCASQSTKKSKRSGNSARNYWDLGGSVGSGSVLAGEA